MLATRNPQTWETSAQWEGVIAQVLLPAILSIAADSGGVGWDFYEVGVHDRAAGLRLIAKLSVVNKFWRDVVCSWVEYAAMKLAQFDLTWTWCRRFKSRDRFVVGRFDDAMSVFSFTWKLRKPIPDRLRLLPMRELSGAELSLLRTELGSGWQERGAVPSGAD